VHLHSGSMVSIASVSGACMQVGCWETHSQTGRLSAWHVVEAVCQQCGTNDLCLAPSCMACRLGGAVFSPACSCTPAAPCCHHWPLWVPTIRAVEMQAVRWCRSCHVFGQLPDEEAAHHGILSVGLCSRCGSSMQLCLPDMLGMRRYEQIGVALQEATCAGTGLKEE
jgi:hypothetical protein